jgi:hypothetical protein
VGLEAPTTATPGNRAPEKEGGVMPRKTGATLEEQRANIRKRYKHGTRARKRLVNVESLTDVERAAKKEAACYLKAADYSFSYIADALGLSSSGVRKWFEDEGMRVKVAQIQADYVDGAVKLLKTYAIELIEMLVEIARSDVDAKTRITAITEALDRMGMSKVNKSQSAVVSTERTEVDLTDKTGLLEAMRDAPPEIQQEMARKMDEMMALAGEHTDRSVAHA